MERDERDREIDRMLARHAAVTVGVAPDPTFTDAVMDATAMERPAADPLAGIARATSELDADGSFSSAVMARTSLRSAERAPSWLDGVVRSAPLAIGLAAVAAAASFWIFLSGQGELDATVVSSVDAVEVSE
jgi:hypothetical protein